MSCHCTLLDGSTGRKIVILFVIDCSLHFMSAVWLQERTVFFFSWTVQWNLHVCMVHSGFRDTRLSGTVFSEDFTKWILKFCHQESGDDISIDFLFSLGAYQLRWESARVSCVCVFLFRVARAGRAAFASNGWASHCSAIYCFDWSDDLDLWRQLWHTGFVEHWNVRQLLRKLVQSWRMRQFRLNILRLHQVERQTSDKWTELRLRLLMICIMELLRSVIISIAVVVVIQIGTMRREGLQFVKSAVFHLRLWDWAMYFCFWTRTEVSFDPILSYFQESTGDWICKVHCMLYNGTFTQVLFGDSVPHQRRTASSTSSIVILHAPRWY